MNTIRRTIELDPATDSRLSELASRRGQDPASVIADAIELLDGVPPLPGPDVDEDLRRLEEFRRTRMAVAAKEIWAWTSSWGTREELPPPLPRRTE